MIQQERAGGNAGGRSDGWAARSRFRKQGEPRVRVARETLTEDPSPMTA